MGRVYPVVCHQLPPFYFFGFQFLAVLAKQGVLTPTQKHRERRKRKQQRPGGTFRGDVERKPRQNRARLGALCAHVCESQMWLGI